MKTLKEALTDCARGNGQGVSTQELNIMKVRQAKEKMDKEFSEETNLDILSREASLSKFYFLRYFKKVYGCTPYQYLLSKRLNLAYSMLKQNKTTINEVAYVCGFNNRRSFTKAFKRHFHQCPISTR